MIVHDAGSDTNRARCSLVAMKRWPGVRAARRVVEFLDIRSESVGESVGRVRLMEDGLPAQSLSTRSTDQTASSWPASTSTGKSSGPSASSMERSSTVGSSSLGSGSRT